MEDGFSSYSSLYDTSSLLQFCNAVIGQEAGYTLDSSPVLQREISIFDVPVLFLSVTHSETSSHRNSCSSIWYLLQQTASPGECE
ncbi:hypothetical protein CHARACLAT_005711 [Characodon lateralis]|uniref:Uncharacterized protein n=1 Tax=Characodon lateralis TaxID=208331 RepID=A0ABU7F0V2_9TELE|nr:hypothetical protein [Characodon lateralis]